MKHSKIPHKLFQNHLYVEFVITSFNKNMPKALYIIAVYKSPPKMKIIYFNSILKTILKDMPKNYPTI
jgi:hypothetical protein